MSDLLVFVTEPAGRMLWTNPALEKHTGYTLADFQYDNPDNPFIHPEDLPDVNGALAAFAESPDPVSPEIVNRFITKWGDVVTFRSRVFKMDWDGQVAFRVECREIRANPHEVEAARSAARYRSLVDASPDGILRVASDGSIFYSNRRFQEIVHRDPVALKSGKLLDVFHPEDHERVAATLAAEPGGEGTRIEVRLADGERWVEARVLPTSHPDDQGLLHVIVRDITEARDLEHQLRHAQKLESLGVLAGGIAHDFNNLLTAMLGSISLAENEGPVPPVGRHLTDARRAIERAAKLTRSMLTYSGHAPVQRQAVELGLLLQELLPLVQAATTSRTVLEVHDSEPIHVRCDEAQITQVMLNLLTNAAEAHGDEGGVVNVGLRTCDAQAIDALQATWPIGQPTGEHHACICVSDHGPGMSDETLARIFDPFFTTKRAGRGLGLSTVLGIVRGHGGGIAIRTSPDGTTMHVLLPLADDDSSDDASPEDAPHAPTQGGTVLFVDDESVLRELGGRILERAGYRVVTAPNGDEALRLLQRRGASYAIVVLDETMPGLSGSAVLAQIRKTQPTLPVLRTSGFALDPIQARVDAYTAFLPKPYTMAQLVAGISTLLARS